MTVQLFAQNLQLRGTLNLPPRTAIDAEEDIVCAVGNNSFSVIQINSSGQPTLHGQTTLDVANLNSVDMHGSYVLCAGMAAGLIVVDISNPAQPHWTATTILGSETRDISVWDTLAAAATATGVFLIGIEDPQHPHLLTSFARAATWLVFDGSSGQIHVGSPTGAFMLEVSYSAGSYHLTAGPQYGSQALYPVELSPPHVNVIHGAEMTVLNRENYSVDGHYTSAGTIRAMASRNGSTFLGLASAVLQYIDQRANNPEFVTAAGVPGSASGVAVTDHGGAHYVAVAHSGGVSVYEYDPLASPGESFQPVPRGFSLTAYPNPFNSTVTLAYQFDRPGFHTLVVTDILAREVIREKFPLSGSGIHRLDFGNSAAGIYFAGFEDLPEAHIVKLLYLP